MPTTQHTSPRCKMKRYSHGNQATRGNQHNNHSWSKSSSRNDKNNWWRRDDNTSHGHLHTSNHTRLDYTSTSQSTKTTNSDLSNNSTPLLTSTNNNNINPPTGQLSVDINLCSTDSISLQTMSSPYSAEAVQPENSEENHSCPATDLAYTRTHHNYNLHHSFSDSVIPLSSHHYMHNQFSTEPLHIVPQNNAEELSEYKVKESEGNSSLSLSNLDHSSSNNHNSVITKWPSTELFHDFDINSIDHCDSDSRDVSAGTVGNEQLVDNNSAVAISVDTSNNSYGTVEINNDIDFLKSCFPDILSDQVVRIYEECEHNTERAVGKLLQIPTSSAEKLIGFPLDFNNVARQENEDGRKLFQEDSSNQTMEDSKEVIMSEDIQTAMDEDEKIARALQEQLDKEFMEEKSSGLATNKFLQNQNESCLASDSCVVQQSHDDEGLILRLPPSLASKLQDMFGSVEEHLITDGEL